MATTRLARLIRIGQLVLVTAGALALVLAVVWLVAERRWARYEPLGDEEAFLHGTIGLEFAPVKYVLLIDDLSGEWFRRGDGPYRPWTREYGFAPNPDSTGAPLCMDNLATEAPVGLSVSRLLPFSASPVPVEFAGFSCAACHSAYIETQGGGPGRLVYGPGTIALDLIAWRDAFANAVFDPELSGKAIQEAYAARCGDDRGPIGRWLERLLLDAWLGAVRTVLLEGARKHDLPFAGAELRDPDSSPTGPSRTRSFRSIVRKALGLPGSTNHALTKVPAALEQNELMRPRAQFDGSIGDYVTRSMIAAYASGASTVALASPEIEHNVRYSAHHTLYLGSAGTPAAPQAGGAATPVPAYAELFPGHPIDPTLAAEGLAVYLEHCSGCHGYRPLAPAGGRDWVVAGEHVEHLHQVSLLDPALGPPTIDTDPVRVHFRYNDILMDAMYTAFPGKPDQRARQLATLAAARQRAFDLGRGAEAGLWEEFEEAFDESRRQFPLGHPFYFEPSVLHDDKGYVNNPLPRLYLRAPYLHNGSVPTAAQLVHLEPRPDRFCRGWNPYDPEAVGLVAPAPGPDGCPEEMPFLFDTSAFANSNRGHDFPWPYDAARSAERTAQLEALLEYLKTL